MTNDNRSQELLTRREAVRRVSAMFGGVALVGQTAILSACSRTNAGTGSGAGDDK